jgi:hypothetical protein
LAEYSIEELETILREIIGDRKLTMGSVNKRFGKIMRGKGHEENSRDLLKLFGQPKGFKKMLVSQFTGTIMIENRPDNPSGSNPWISLVGTTAKVTEKGAQKDGGSSLEELDQLYISIDAQNAINGDRNDIVTLIHVLKQLNLFAEKIDYSLKLETVIPGWMVKNNGKYDYNENLAPHSRLIKIFLNNKDKELDDYLVVSIAAANDGYYLSNDKKMHEHIRKNDEWRDGHRISFRTILETNQIRLIFPEGEIADKYNELFENGDLNIEFDEWETAIRTETVEKEKLKEERAPMKYFCPDCDEKFPKLKLLNSHREETGHAALTCEECGEFLRSEKQLKEHLILTGHGSYSGKIIKSSEMRIQKSEEEIVEKSSPTQAITNGENPIILSTEIKAGISNFSTVKGIRLPRDPEHLRIFITILLQLDLKTMDYRNALEAMRNKITGMDPSMSDLRTMRQISLCYNQEPEEIFSETIFQNNPVGIISELHKYLIEERIPSWNDQIDVNKVNEYFHSIESTYS